MRKNNSILNYRQLSVGLILALSLLYSRTWSQDGFPIRTRWTAPDGSQPTSYAEWQAKWSEMGLQKGGEIAYRSQPFFHSQSDSFFFGRDYAYFKAFVRSSDGKLCEAVAPEASFIVLLNGDDRKILTDDTPRWSRGDPNLSGKGYYGIELGNFKAPAIEIGDSFTVVFSVYRDEHAEQGQQTEIITGIPFPPAFPTFLDLAQKNLPLAPQWLALKRDSLTITLSWRQKPGLSYNIYRRSLQDTLALNFPRFQYQKIGAGISDSTFVDRDIDTEQTYGYILFAHDPATGLTSGHSIEIKETQGAHQARAILVQPELYPAIQANLMQMVQDWEDEGAQVVVYSMQFRQAQDLRDTLKAIDHLVGALLIGNFPVPWFQHSISGTEGISYQEYPCDLYFMDLDGIWQDNFQRGPGGELLAGSDGILDTHLDNFPRSTKAPEIVVGRITPTPGMGHAATIVNFYLDKCHRYRHQIGDIRQDFKALAYVDDDWADWGQDIAQKYLSQAYPEYVCINDINETTATDYRLYLDNHYSLIHVWVHSWSQGHSFKINDGTDTESFFNYQILPARTNANFYHLFACGNSRYIEDKNCAAIYALQTDTGINTIGSTHSGGMLEYNYFYEQLAHELSFGAAFLQTFQYVGKNGFTESATSWYYGLTFNGDPFVIPQPGQVSRISHQSKSAVPDQLKLANFPNPFCTHTFISFQLPEPGPIEVTIFNSLGQVVRTYQDKTAVAGVHAIAWDGKDLYGNPVASGWYVYQVRVNGYGQTKSMLFIK